MNATLVPDPGRPSMPVLVGRVLGAEFRSAMRRLSRRLGFSRLHDAVPGDWAIPDSELAVRAVEAATAECPDFILRHCFRSYCFGAILAARNQLKLDRETFFVAAMLHDLGLCGAHADAPGSFEWVGAGLARDFCIEAGEPAERAALIHNSIALHTSVGIADQRQPEIALLHFGTGMDLFGMRVEEIPAAVLQKVLAEYPRAEFKSEFSPCLNREVEKKPNCQFAGAAAVGIVGRIVERLDG